MQGIPKTRRIPSGKRNQTRGVFMTWKGTSGNGWRTCMQGIITATVRLPIQPARRRASAANAGSEAPRLLGLMVLVADRHRMALAVVEVVRRLSVPMVHEAA